MTLLFRVGWVKRLLFVVAGTLGLGELGGRLIRLIGSREKLDASGDVCGMYVVVDLVVVCGKAIIVVCGLVVVTLAALIVGTTMDMIVGVVTVTLAAIETANVEFNAVELDSTVESGLLLDGVDVVLEAIHFSTPNEQFDLFGSRFDSVGGGASVELERLLVRVVVRSSCISILIGRV